MKSDFINYFIKDKNYILFKNFIENILTEEEKSIQQKILGFKIFLARHDYFIKNKIIFYLKI